MTSHYCRMTLLLESGRYKDRENKEKKKVKKSKDQKVHQN